MAIVQHDPARPNMAIQIDAANPARLLIDPIPLPFPGGTTAAATCDLTPLQGGPGRLYLNYDGSVTTNLYGDHYWLLAEAILPDRQFDQVLAGVDPNGQEIFNMVERPLDLTAVEVVVFPLPEVA